MAGYAGDEDVSFETDLDPKLPALDLDREQICRALTNLIDNAIVALRRSDGRDEPCAQGRVVLRTSHDSRRQSVRLEVLDDGIGIPPEDRQRIFEPYFSTLPDPHPAVSWHEAAAYSLATLTAWRMLIGRAKVRPGELVLIWGIGGGVASIALSIAKLAGARVIATSSSDEKLERARQMGADITLNHATVDVAKEVRALTARRGVDVVVENVGEATWNASLRLLGRGARLVTCGGTTGPRVTLDIRRLFWFQWDILGSTMGGASDYQEIVRLLGQGQLRPVVDSVHPLEGATAAFERLERGEQMGKVVVDIPE